MDEPIIKIKGISKEFEVSKEKSVFKALVSRKMKKVSALKGINLTIKKGEFVGMIGPNGAGKSTLIKIVTGILVPSRGRVEVMGLVPYEERQKNSRNIGVVFGQRSQLWWDIPVINSYDLLKHLFDVPDKTYRKNMKAFKEVLGIDKLLYKPVRKLSLGERVKCDIAASLLHSPKIVYLDEPTIGLDVEAKFRIRNFLKKLNQEGLTIIMTTHDMGDIEELCPRMVIIDKGRKVYDGPTADIRKKVTKERAVIIDYKGVSPKIKLPSGVIITEKEGDRIIYKVNTSKISVSGFIKKILTKYDVDDIKIEEPSIEEVVRKVYREGI